MLDLAQFAAPVVEQLPLDPESNLLLTPELVPAPPADVVTTMISAGGTHTGADYGQVIYREVRFSGPGPVFRPFGVLVFAAVLHQRDVVLHFTGGPRDDVGPDTGSHPIRRLRIEAAHSPWQTSTDSPGTVELVARSFDYWPDPARRRFALRDADPRERPTVIWEDHGIPGYASADAEEATGFGWAVPTCMMATLLLDVGHPACPPGQFSLEGDHGFGGAGRYSAQIQLYVSDEPWGWM